MGEGTHARTRFAAGVATDDQAHHAADQSTHQLACVPANHTAHYLADHAACKPADVPASVNSALAQRIIR